MRDRLHAFLGRHGYPSEIVTEDLVTPLDWQAQGMAAGTPFALAHTFPQTGPFRPANVERRLPGLFFAGSGTVPGVGVPMVLVSGKLAAERVGELSAMSSSSTELAAVDPDPERRLAAGYRQCAKLTWRYGTTYFWGALLLPKPRRRHVYAVYALCRLADDIVDDQEVVRSSTPAEVAARLERFADDFRTALAERTSPDPVIAAVVHTVITCGIDPECFDRFFGAMAMDLTTPSYAIFEDLCGYMEGSAAVIGEMMLPVLEPTSPAAREPARALGLAFQLTNFLRDVDEDLDRGRVYLPQDDLRRFGVDLSPSARRPRSGRPSWPTRSNATGSSTPKPTAGSLCCRPARPVASARPGCSTPASSSGSRRQTTTCSAPEPACRPGARP